MEKILVGLLALIAVFAASAAGGVLIREMGSGESGPQIALLPVHGFLTRDTEIKAFNADEGVERLEESLEDPKVGAVVLDINSPGGTVVATEMIMRAVNGSEKPVVAWIGGSGASGGYFVASACDYIVSDPLSITGSIGASSQVINAEELLDKVGLRINTFTSGEFKSVGSFHRNMTEEEKEMMQGMVNEIHGELLSYVVKKRGLEGEEVARIEEGQIMLGREAFEIGLVDELGGREKAISKAAEMANLTEYGVRKVEREQGLSDMLRELTSVTAAQVGEGMARGLVSLEKTENYLR